MNRSALRSLTLAFALCLALSVTATPAMAEITGTVPDHAMIGTVDVFGMTDAQVRSVIATQVSAASLPPLQLNVAGQVFALSPAHALSVDVESMVAAAFAASPATTLTVAPRFTASTTAIATFVSNVAGRVNRASLSATYYVRSGRLRWRPERAGITLNVYSARELIRQELLAEAASGAARPVVALAYYSLAPRVTNGKLGRAIIVDLSSRRLWLYDHSTLIKTYGVAIGMPGHTTPKGAFKIIAKKKFPRWGNPGSAWADDMPNSIAPGPRNPLGTRALYLNVSGIRIHGTSKTGSIGHAASHGCVRVANRNIEKLYPLVPADTRVFIVQ